MFAIHQPLVPASTCGHQYVRIRVCQIRMHLPCRDWQPLRGDVFPLEAFHSFWTGVQTLLKIWAFAYIHTRVYKRCARTLGARSGRQSV